MSLGPWVTWGITGMGGLTALLLLMKLIGVGIPWWTVLIPAGIVVAAAALLVVAIVAMWTVGGGV